MLFKMLRVSFYGVICRPTQNCMMVVVDTDGKTANNVLTFTIVFAVCFFLTVGVVSGKHYYDIC